MSARSPRTGERSAEVPSWVGGTASERRAAEERRRVAGGRATAGARKAIDERRRAAERRAGARRSSQASPGLRERRWLFSITTLLLLYGLVMAYSASTAQAYFTYGSSFYFLQRQAVFAAVGVVVMVVLSRLDYGFWRRMARPVFAVALACLAAVLIPSVGSQINGARRWIIVSGNSFSPSELAKLACVVLVAMLATRRPGDVLDGRRLFRLAAIGIVPAAALIMAEPDLGSTLVLALAVIAVLIAAGARLRHLGLLGMSACAAVAVLIAIEPYRVARLGAFLQPWRDPQGSGYQTTQSLISIASGRIFGVGLGNSVQKFGFLPEQTTDMITGIIGEELGMVGLLALVALYVALAWIMFRIALNCRERFGTLLAVGLGSAISGQAAINIGAAMGVLPLTGVPLPLVSCGGSSLVVVLAGIGIVANIATNRRSYIVASPERTTRSGRRWGDGRSPGPSPRRR